MVNKYKKQRQGKLKRKRVLVLGSRGMLGSDLMDILMGQYSVHGLDLGEIDITHRGPCITTIKELKPDIVINSVAYTDVDGCETNKEQAYNVNAYGARNVSIACSEAHIKLIHISTDYVFDGKKSNPLTEEDLPQPLSIYAQSKLLGENLVHEFLPNATICRTSWLFGKHGKNFVTTILHAAQDGKPLKVVQDQAGSPTYTRDLSKAIMNLIGMDSPPIIHITNDGCCSWYQFARRILDLAGFSGIEIIPISTGELGRPAPRPAYSVLNCDKYAKLAGSKLRHWETALIDFLEELT